MSGKYSKRGEQFFLDIESIATQVITKYLNADKETAEQIAHEVTHQLNTSWGGSMFYVPKHSSWHAHQRDLAIYNEFNGINHAELAEKYKLSVPYIYEITKRIRDSLPKGQFDLFEN